MEQTPTPEQPIAPDKGTEDYAKSDSVIVIPRAVSYLVVAVAFFALGAFITAASMNALFKANSSENQELIQSAVATLQAAGVAGGGQEAAGLQAGQKYEVAAEDNPSKGDDTAPITIIEFSDFRCPYCGRFFNDTLNPLLTNYAGKVKLVYRDYPILGQTSIDSAIAGECANLQGKFWEFHDLAFANQQVLGRDKFIEWAGTIGADVTTFTTCIDQRETVSLVQADYSVAQGLGVSGTPAFFINGTFLSGAQPYDVFAQVIDAELKAAESSGVN